MKIGEFVDKYCQDIVQKSQEIDAVMADDGLPYDEIVEDESGSKMKVVYSANRRIPIRDIIEMERKDFAKIYSSPDDLETYDRYCDSIILLEGEEALQESEKWKELKVLRIVLSARLLDHAWMSNDQL